MCIQAKEGIKHCKLVAAHAGLEGGETVDEQFKMLKGKDTQVPKVGPLSGRAGVWGNEVKEHGSFDCLNSAEASTPS